MSDKNGENKLFLGGLSIHTGKESLMTYFGDFGEVVDTVVIMDLEGKSRGFGFVTFGDRDAYNKCLETTHEIDGKSVEVKRAVPKGESRGSSGGGESSGSARTTRVKKLFLGGLSLETSVENIQEALLPEFPADTSLTVTIMTDKDTGKPRGFAFVTAEPPPDRSDDCIYDAVDEITQKKFIKILDRSVEVKGAVPKDEISRRSGGGGGGGGRGQQRPSSDYGSSRYGGGGGGGYDDAYSSYQRASYEAMRDYYARSREYGMAGYPAMSMPSYDRGAGASSYYPDSSASASYPAYWMGAGYQQQTGGYQQTGSNYGPTRGYGDTSSSDRRDRSSSSHSYHPYSRR